MVSVKKGKVIGIAGPARSGKDLLGSLILQHILPSYDYTDNYTDGIWHIINLADRLKCVVNNLYGWVHTHSNGFLKEVPCTTLMPNMEQSQAIFMHYLDGILTEDQARLCSEALHRIVHTPYKSSCTTLRISPRKAYQLIGTEVVRSVRDDAWITCVDRRLNIGHCAVVCDVRMENEVNWVRENGVLIHIESDRKTIESDHITECGLAVCTGDITVENNGSKQQLGRTAAGILEKLITAGVLS